MSASTEKKKGSGGDRPSQSCCGVETAEEETVVQQRRGHGMQDAGPGSQRSQAGADMRAGTGTPAPWAGGHCLQPRACSQHESPFWWPGLTHHTGWREPSAWRPRPKLEPGLQDDPTVMGLRAPWGHLGDPGFWVKVRAPQGR